MKRWLFISLLFLPLYAKQGLWDIYVATKTKTYQSIDSSTFNKAEACFKELLKQNTLTPNIQTCLNQLDLRAIKIEPSYIALVEKEKNGRGFYLINTQHNNHNMLSIPHRFFDKKTGTIGFKLFKEHPYRAIAFNTVHRHTIDMAHTTNTLFLAFHLAFVQIYKDEYIYQLHGFSNHSRRTQQGKNISMILSTAQGSSFSTNEKICACVEKTLPYSCGVFGRDIFELGATTNVQLNSLQARGFTHFIHIEMNVPLRKSINERIKSRQKLDRCL